GLSKYLRQLKDATTSWINNGVRLAGLMAPYEEKATATGPMAGRAQWRFQQQTFRGNLCYRALSLI
ncbi:MAG: hypothetical protein KDD27_13965, partial [Saprospiraceae bacterium]|nr:hypothetical protein [Saprospiraceae bacterium]